MSRGVHVPNDVPGADELAAIAAAFVALTGADHEQPARAEASRWSLSARLPIADARAARFASRAASRWNVSGRLDG